MVTVIQEPGLLGPGFQQGMGALAQGLQERGDSRRKQQGMTLLDDLIQSGERDPFKILTVAQQAGIDPGPLMKAIELSQPSEFEKIVSGASLGTPQPNLEPAQEKGAVNNVVTTDDDRMDKISPEQKSVLTNLSEDQIARMANSKNARDRATADVAIKLQDKQKQEFLENRKYHSKLSDEYLKEISSTRKSTQAKRNDLRNFEYAIGNRDLGFFSKDNLAKTLGQYGKGLVSAEGKLADNAIKNYLVNDLGDVSARGQNMFLEKRILSSLGEVGTSQAANEAWIIAEKGRLEFDEAKVKAADDITEYYENNLGYVPRNIDKLVDEQMGPIAEQIQLRQAYKLRELDERQMDPKQIEQKIEEKVVPGTPLTKQMAQLFLRKYGEDAINKAQERGYTILTLEEYEAL